jgi:hypothetical protein
VNTTSPTVSGDPPAPSSPCRPSHRAEVAQITWTGNTKAMSTSARLRTFGRRQHSSSEPANDHGGDGQPEEPYGRASRRAHDHPDTREPLGARLPFGGRRHPVATTCGADSLILVLIQRVWPTISSQQAENISITSVSLAALAPWPTMVHAISQSDAMT